MFAGLNIFHVGVFFEYSFFYLLFPPHYRKTRRISHFFLLEVETFVILKNLKGANIKYVALKTSLCSKTKSFVF